MVFQVSSFLDYILVVDRDFDRRINDKICDSCVVEQIRQCLGTVLRYQMSAKGLVSFWDVIHRQDFHMAKYKGKGLKSLRDKPCL